MKVDLFTSSGTKKGSLELPAAMFEAKINEGLMHLALVRQQSNRRHPIAHVKHRGEIVGTTKKAFQQKGTGRARRGALRSPLLRGGGKSFGPRNEANFVKDMPRKMRRAALFSCLSLKASEGAIIGLEGYVDEVKTKTFMTLLQKLPVTIGRRILFVLGSPMRGLELSARNVPRVKTLSAKYLNPEDVLGATNIVFLSDAVQVAENTFCKEDTRIEKKAEKIKKEDDAQAAAPKKATKAPKAKKEAATKAAPKKSAKKKALPVRSSEAKTGDSSSTSK